MSAINTGYKHLLLFLQCFQKLSFSRGIKRSGLCDKGLTCSTAELCCMVQIYQTETCM